MKTPGCEQLRACDTSEYSITRVPRGTLPRRWEIGTSSTFCTDPPGKAGRVGLAQADEESRTTGSYRTVHVNLYDERKMEQPPSPARTPTAIWKSKPAGGAHRRIGQNSHVPPGTGTSQCRQHKCPGELPQLPRRTSTWYQQSIPWQLARRRLPPTASRNMWQRSPSSPTRTPSSTWRVGPEVDTQFQDPDGFHGVRILADKPTTPVPYASAVLASSAARAGSGPTDDKDIPTRTAIASSKATIASCTFLNPSRVRSAAARATPHVRRQGAVLAVRRDDPGRDRRRARRASPRHLLA